MESRSRRVLLVLCMCVFSGCSMLPRALHPSQLWKMNRQQPWDEGTLSVPDPVDQRLSSTATDTWSATASDRSDAW